MILLASQRQTVRYVTRNTPYHCILCTDYKFEIYDITNLSHLILFIFLLELFEGVFPYVND